MQGSRATLDVLLTDGFDRGVEPCCRIAVLKNGVESRRQIVLRTA
jgi:hypothetical protein